MARVLLRCRTDIATDFWGNGRGPRGTFLGCGSRAFFNRRKRGLNHVPRDQAGFAAGLAAIFFFAGHHRWRRRQPVAGHEIRADSSAARWLADAIHSEPESAVGLHPFHPGGQERQYLGHPSRRSLCSKAWSRFKATLGTWNGMKQRRLTSAPAGRKRGNAQPSR